MTPQIPSVFKTRSHRKAVSKDIIKRKSVSFCDFLHYIKFIFYGANATPVAWLAEMRKLLSLALV